MKRVLAVGCSHAIYADPDALNAVLRFKRAFKPHRTVHLGDAFDTTALRSGAKGTKDESAKIPPDIDAGIKFLERLEPTDFILGNHDWRAFSLQDHPNAVISFAAGQIVKGIRDTCKKLHCRLVPYTGIYQGLMIGGYRYMHGVLYNENAVRDHAETFGKVVHAHTHRAGMAVGRRADSPAGFCVGTLTKRENMDYASNRRSTLGWSQGFVWGEFTDHYSQLWLHEQPRGATAWHLPN